MERLYQRFNTNNLKVLINREKELLLLMEDRHVICEKENLSYLNNFNFNTTLKILNKKDVLKIINKKYKDLMEEDIDKIIPNDNGFEVVTKPSSLLGIGSFQIFNKLN